MKPVLLALLSVLAVSSVSADIYYRPIYRSAWSSEISEDAFSVIMLEGFNGDGDGIATPRGGTESLDRYIYWVTDALEREGGFAYPVMVHNHTGWTQEARVESNTAALRVSLTRIDPPGPRSSTQTGSYVTWKYDPLGRTSSTYYGRYLDLRPESLGLTSAGTEYVQWGDDILWSLDSQGVRIAAYRIPDFSAQGWTSPSIFPQKDGTVTLIRYRQAIEAEGVDWISIWKMDENFNVLDIKAYARKGNATLYDDLSTAYTNSRDEIGSGGWVTQFTRRETNLTNRFPGNQFSSGDRILGNFYWAMNGTTRLYPVYTSSLVGTGFPDAEMLDDGRMQLFGAAGSEPIVIRTYDSTGLLSATNFKPYSNVSTGQRIGSGGRYGSPYAVQSYPNETIYVKWTLPDGRTLLSSTDEEGAFLGSYTLPSVNGWTATDIRTTVEGGLAVLWDRNGTQAIEGASQQFAIWTFDRDLNRTKVKAYSYR